MGFRFRKRIKVMPGIYLNIGKNGVSTTIGPRGASINIGKKGVYLNTGIPGSGISYRQRLFNNNPSPNPKINSNPSDPILIENEEPDSTDDITTSEGLTGLKELLEESRAQRTELAVAIKELSAELTLLERKSVRIKNNFLVRFFTAKSKAIKIDQEIEVKRKELTEIEKEYEDAKADINIFFDDDLKLHYSILKDAFENLKKCKVIWDITSISENHEIKSSARHTVQRREVKFDSMFFDYIKSENPSFVLKNSNGSYLYIFPAFILLTDLNNNLKLIDLKDVTITFGIQRFQESAENIPSDSKIVDYAWAKANKDGSRDLRYSSNYQIPIVNYGSIELFSPNGLNETYYFSNVEFAHQFSDALSTYLSLLKGENPKDSVNTTGLPFISRENFEVLKEFSDHFLSFLKKLENDKGLCSYLAKKGIDSINASLTGGFHVDLLRWFNLVSDLSNLKSKEAFGLLFLIGRRYNLEYFNEYENINNVYKPNVLSLFEDMKKNMGRHSDLDEENSILAPILEEYDPDLKKEYLTNLYRFASIVVKSDGTVSAKEEEALKRIMSIGEKKESTNSSKVSTPENSKKETIVPPKENSLEESLKELNSLIGLSSVKEEINSLINFIKVQRARESSGLKSSSVSYHMVFTGNPGTGKTTVARIVSEIYKNLGVLTQGQLIETDRSGLVAEFVGQTAVKVNKTVDSALNGILFIDEAYSLVGENRDEFGREAVATLMKRMEDNRDKLVVIMAGYTNEMSRFIDTNPGFKSRFNRYIEFADYTPHELLSIFKSMCQKFEYMLTDDAENKLIELISTAYQNRDRTFGNGRFIRNLFEKTMEKQANRIASIPSLTKDILTSITAEDITSD